MKLIKENNITKLISNEGYVLKKIGNEDKEFDIYYFKKAYVPNNYTIEEATKNYEEVEENVSYKSKK